MDPMILVLSAVLGAAVGSFLNVVIYRLPRSESLVHPGSHCPGCEKPVAVRDNVPLFSWLWLHARCRSCGEHISARYPLVELTCLVTFGAVVLARGVEPELALLLPFTALLIAVAGIDLEHRIIPNKLVVPALAYGLVMGSVIDLAAMPERLAAGAGAFVFLLVAALAYPAGMGMGDVKLAGVMGLYLGISVVPALFARFPGRFGRGRGDHGARGRRRPQEGRSLRALPRPRRAGGRTGGARDHRSLQGSVPFVT